MVTDWVDKNMSYYHQQDILYVRWWNEWRCECEKGKDDVIVCSNKEYEKKWSINIVSALSLFEQPMLF